MNADAKNNVVENPKPDWSVAFFWEDITAIVKKIIELIVSLFGYNYQ